MALTEIPLKRPTQVAASLSRAIQRWREVVGTECVEQSPWAIQEYSRSSLPQASAPVAIVRPASQTQVASAMVIATEEGVPVFPISRGKNWGYGDACPVTAGQVVLDLSRLNRVVELNRKLAYVVVEPGVTQQQLADHLLQHAPELIADMTGAGPETSVLGNILERGVGHTPLGDRCRHTCGMEVVLADGRIISTGMGSIKGSRVSHTAPWGLGPALDGLFSQSNLGVVTKMGLHLMPRPAFIEAFAISFDADQLPEAIEALRWLRLNDVVRSTVHIGNDLRILATQGSYPWRRANGETPLPRALRQVLRQEMGIGTWTLVGGVYGNAASVSAAKQAIARQFRTVGPVSFFSRKSQGLRQILRSRLTRKPRHPGLKPVALSVLGLLEGKPSQDHLRGVAWRSRQSPGDAEQLDPRDFGLIWMAPVVPMTAEDCQSVLTLTQDVLARHAFDPLITLTSISPRALYCTISLAYDKQDVADVQRAQHCYQQLFSSLVEAGFPPYRLANPLMSSIGPYAPDFWRVCTDLKQALDPEGVLAPGRYEPERAELPGATDG